MRARLRLPLRPLALGATLFSSAACPADDPSSETGASAITLTTGNESADTGSTGDEGDDSNDTNEGNDTNDSNDTEGEGQSYCAHECQADADCFINAMDLGYICDGGTCRDPSVDASCTTDEECVAILSGWAFGADCTPGGGECEPATQVCLEIEGAGRCATAANDLFSCADLGFDEIPTTDIEGNMVVVCGRADAACNLDNARDGKGYCYAPCGSDADCAAPSYPQCNVGTGLCECSSDADCAMLGSQQYASCNAGVCGCGSDQDCIGAGVGDVCHSSGQCGCTEDAACLGVANGYDGGMIICKQF